MHASTHTHIFIYCACRCKYIYILYIYIYGCFLCRLKQLPQILSLYDAFSPTKLEFFCSVYPFICISLCTTKALVTFIFSSNMQFSERVFECFCKRTGCWSGCYHLPQWQCFYKLSSARPSLFSLALASGPLGYLVQSRHLFYPALLPVKALA